MDDLKVLSETDLFSSDYSSVNEDNSSLKYLTKIYCNNNKDNDRKLKGINQMNTNSPWLFNIFKKKFHRSKNNRESKKENNSKTLIDEILEKPSTNGIWIINEKEIENFDQSRDVLSSTSNSSHFHHYQYDFNSIGSLIKTHYTTNRYLSLLEPITGDVHLISGNSRVQTKSTSARQTHPINSSSSKRGKGHLKSAKKKKKSKYYQEHFLTSDEIELREALRIIDLDNVGFFPPNDFYKLLKDIGIHSNDIEKIRQCLPIDEDGHYSIDNLIKLFLGKE